MAKVISSVTPHHRAFNRSNYAGLYMPNQFLITMSATHPFFVRQADENFFDPSRAYFPVYAHEYWHFLQNTTTLSGFKSFAFSQHLLHYLSKSAIVNADGTVTGSSAITDAEQQDMSTLIEAHQSLKGDPGPAIAENDFEVDFRVLNVSRIHRTLGFRDRSIPLPEVALEVELTYATGEPSQRDAFLLGSLAIEESVAFAVEEAIASAPVEPVPVFPYRVLERLFEREVGSADLPAVRAALGTLALMTTHPGPALIDFLHMYGKAIRDGRPKHEALDMVRRDAMVAIRPPVRLALTSDIDELVNMHRGRGLIDGAARWLGSMFRRSLERRLQDPFFDLGALFPRFYAPSFRALHNEYFCDAIQERPDARDEQDALTHDDFFMRDDLVTFTEERDASGHTPSDYVRTLQAQQHYVAEHVDWQNRTLAPSGAARCACPYYTSCNLDLRRDKPDVCHLMPWAHYDAGERLCWYGSGVAGTLGTVRLKKVIP